MEEVDFEKKREIGVMNLYGSDDLWGKLKKKGGIDGRG